jgi:outer membrane protein insertion porin family
LKHGISYSDSFLTGIKGSFKTGINTTFAGIGGNTKHLKNELFGAYVVTIWKKATLKFSGICGLLTKVGNKNPLIVDSFALGLDSFRGFDDCGIGPVAQTTRIAVDRNGNPKISIDPETLKVKVDKSIVRDFVGASRYCKGTIELKFPVGFPEELQFRGFTFTDFGTIWSAPEKGKKFLQEQDDGNGGKLVLCSLDSQRGQLQNGKIIDHRILDSKKIRISLGFGVSFLTPLGPMVFTYAIPIRKEKYDEQQRFLVGFSTTF